MDGARDAKSYSETDGPSSKNLASHSTVREGVSVGYSWRVQTRSERDAPGGPLPGAHPQQGLLGVGYAVGT